jgi:TatD DNase family protein
MLIDSHAHVDGPEFDQDRQQVLERAQQAGVTTVLNVGTGDPHSDAFDRAVELGRTVDFVYTAIGTHPHDARLYDDAAELKTESLVKSSPKVIAWGEIGLDFHYDNSPRDVQMAVFAKQLGAAQRCGLPVIIHTREAEAETIEILTREYSNSNRRGVFHCFSGSETLARKALDLGFFISFSGIITFKKAQELRDVARIVPLDRLLVETDCPFLSPIPFRGKRNEPAYVVEVAKCVSEIHGKHVDDIGELTTSNFKELFEI